MKMTQDRNYLRQVETRDLLLVAERGDNELALVLAERLKESQAELAEPKEPDWHGDCCTCFD